jgi:hypothetical protein
MGLILLWRCHRCKENYCKERLMACFFKIKN